MIIWGAVPLRATQKGLHFMQAFLVAVPSLSMPFGGIDLSIASTIAQSSYGLLSYQDQYLKCLS